MSTLVFTIDGGRQVQAWRGYTTLADRLTFIETCDQTVLAYDPARVEPYNPALRAERRRVAA